MTAPLRIGDATLYTGDVLSVLATLPDESVHCVMTSPPYYSLRDYGVPGQIGLEETPDAYIAKMVEVFREVRRVLRSDGTCFINIGDSYAGSGRGPTGKNGIQNAEKRQGFTGAASLRDARERGTACKAQSDSTEPDSACHDLCDECATALPNRISHTDRPLDGTSLHPLPTGHDIEHPDASREPQGDAPPGVQESTNPESSRQPLAECSGVSIPAGKCRSCVRTLGRNGPASVHTTADPCASPKGQSSTPDHLANTDGSAETGGSSDDHKSDTVSVSAWGDYTIPSHHGQLKPKDLIGIPWMLAFALRADGWYLRSDIIWSKPNPMPDSVTDRPTKAHEYLFLLSKSARYFYDAEAIREPLQPSSIERGEYPHNSFAKNQFAGSPIDKRHPNGKQVKLVKDIQNPAGRNRRTVWTIATEAYPLAHFATFPRKLVQPCILAGCPEHACPKCGAPWVSEREPTPEYAEKLKATSEKWYQRKNGGPEEGKSGNTFESAHAEYIKTGEHPTCTCGLPAIGGMVLDPFGGSGTTAEVALEYGRKAILIELKPEYVELAKKRLRPVAGRPLLAFGG